MRRKIIWQHWQNPYGNEESEFVDEDKSPWELREELEESPKAFKVRPVIPTPLGFVPVYPFQNFSETFEFWMGHTNFDITQDVSDKIEATPGVEFLDVITRYCFRIAIGKAFNGTDVKLNIQQNLNAMPPKKGEINPHDMKLDKVTRDKVTLIQETIKKEFLYWAIYVMPNGEIDAGGANTEEGYDMHLELYKGAQEVAGGVIYQYA